MPMAPRIATAEPPKSWLAQRILRDRDAVRRCREITFHQENRDFVLRFQADHGDKVSANLIVPPPPK